MAKKSLLYNFLFHKTFLNFFMRLFMKSEADVIDVDKKDKEV